MEYTDSFLFDHTINHLEVIDCGNRKFEGVKLVNDNEMFTKKGTKVISVTPLLSYEKYSDRSERLITIKNDLGDKVKMRKVCTVEELSLILKEELGMRILYQHKQV